MFRCLQDTASFYEMIAVQKNGALENRVVSVNVNTLIICEIYGE